MKAPFGKDEYESLITEKTRHCRVLELLYRSLRCIVNPMPKLRNGVVTVDANHFSLSHDNALYLSHDATFKMN